MRQWRKIQHISFWVSKYKLFQILNNSKFVIINEIIQYVFKTLRDKDKAGDAILIRLIFALKLRTGRVRLLKFKDGKNQEQSIIKV